MGMARTMNAYEALKSVLDEMGRIVEAIKTKPNTNIDKLFDEVWECCHGGWYNLEDYRIPEP